MTTWYLARSSGWFFARSTVKDLVKEVEVERHSGSSVWIGGRRLARESQYDNYFETFKEARDFVLARIAKELNLLEEKGLRKWIELNAVCDLFGVDVETLCVPEPLIVPRAVESMDQ